MQTLKYYGGKRNLIMLLRDNAIQRGADDGGGFQWKVERDFKPAAVAAIEWGKSGSVVVMLGSGEIWQRVWDSKAKIGVYSRLLPVDKAET